MPYCSLQDLITRFGEDEVTVAADRNGDGQADAAVVDAALEDASAEVDSYLGMRYELPLPFVPAIVRSLCADIAFHRLSPEADTSTEHRRSRYDTATAMLKRLASGETRIEGLVLRPLATGRGPHVQSARRRWYRSGGRQP